MFEQPSSESVPSFLRDWRSLLVTVPVCVALIPISIVGFCQWRAVREAELRAALQRDLIDRGLAPADVERLTDPPPVYMRTPPAGQPAQAQAAGPKMPRED